MSRHFRTPGRALRYYLFYYRVLGLPLAWYLLAGLVLWLVDWLSGGRLSR